MNAIVNNLALPCADKNSYQDEILARKVGRKASTERGLKLWVYVCDHCSQWHLTKQDSGAENNVFAPKSYYDDFVKVPGEGSFWTRIDNLSIEESCFILRTLLNSLTAEKKMASAGLRSAIAEMMAEVSIALHFKTKVAKRKCYFDAVKMVLGEEKAEQLQVEIARLLHLESIHSESNCHTRFESELEVRKAGKSKSSDDGKDYWVYPCSYCSGWHLTSRKRSKHWHVNTLLCDVDDYADILNDPHYWWRIVDMPRDEVDKSARNKIKSIKSLLYMSPRPELQRRIEKVLSILRDEIHMISSILRCDVPTKKVFIDYFSEEDYLKVAPVWYFLKDERSL